MPSDFTAHCTPYCTYARRTPKHPYSLYRLRRIGLSLSAIGYCNHRLESGIQESIFLTLMIGTGTKILFYMQSSCSILTKHETLRLGTGENISSIINGENTTYSNCKLQPLSSNFSLPTSRSTNSGEFVDFAKNMSCPDLVQSTRNKSHSVRETKESKNDDDNNRLLCTLHRFLTRDEIIKKKKLKKREHGKLLHCPAP